MAPGKRRARLVASFCVSALSRCCVVRDRLGLAICMRLVNLMGGDLRVTSEGLNKGCTFTGRVQIHCRPGLPSDAERAALTSQSVQLPIFAMPQPYVSPKQHALPPPPITTVQQPSIAIGAAQSTKTEESGRTLFVSPHKPRHTICLADDSKVRCSGSEQACGR